LNSIPINTDEGELDQEVLDDMKNLIVRYEETKQELKILDEEKKELALDIKEFLKDNDVRNMSDEGWSTAHSQVKGKVSYDFKAMEEDGIDIEKYKSQGAPFEKLNTKLKIKKD